MVRNCEDVYSFTWERSVAGGRGCPFTCRGVLLTIIKGHSNSFSLMGGREVRITILIVLVGALLSVGCNTLVGTLLGEPEESPFKPMADVKTLMTAMIDPAADVLWASVGMIVDEDGVNEWYPKTDEEWATVQDAAVVVMESGNLLMIGDRARDQDTWIRRAQALVDAGTLALEAAASKDADAVFAVGEDVYVACDSCHRLYWIGDEDRGRVRNDSLKPQS